MNLGVNLCGAESHTKGPLALSELSTTLETALSSCAVTAPCTDPKHTSGFQFGQFCVHRVLL